MYLPINQNREKGKALAITRFPFENIFMTVFNINLTFCTIQKLFPTSSYYIFFALGTLKFCLYYDITIYVNIRLWHVYACKSPRTTDMSTEKYFFLQVYWYVICYFIFSLQVYPYVICFKMILGSNTNMLCVLSLISHSMNVFFEEIFSPPCTVPFYHIWGAVHNNIPGLLGFKPRGQESFQLQMGFSFPFLRANNLRSSLLNIRARSFFLSCT